MGKTIDFELFQDNGYPTVEFLQFIRYYKPSAELPILDFLNVVKSGFLYEGMKIKRRYKGKKKIEFHTGGWSGNEEIMDQIISNINLTHFQLQYVSWKRGGHYYFELNIS